MKKSYVEFSLIGAFCEEFLSEAMSCGIKIYDLRNDGNVIYGKTAPYNYKKLAELTRRYKVRMRITEKRGPAIKIIPYKNRYGVPIGMLCYAIMIVLFSGIIWDIQISGNVTVSDALILETLAEYGISAGASNSRLSYNTLEPKMLLAIEKLAWISIENEGSRMYVRVNERLDEDSFAVPIGTPCNVVASRDGQIIDSQVYKGTMLYPKGSGVAKGDIIVSGVVNDGAGNISYNHASAKIIAEYTEEARFYVPFIENKKVNTDKVNVKEYLQFFSFTIPHDTVTPRENCVYRTEDSVVTVFGAEMPWKIRRVIETETEEKEVPHTVERVKTLLNEQMSAYERNFLQDREIVERSVEFMPDEKGIKMIVTYRLRGDIAELKEISVN